MLSAKWQPFCLGLIVLTCLSLDKNDVIGAIFVDLSKAFDSLPQGLLITKFRAYGSSLSACD